jgi:aerobic C4-dicarboxylate transport protein
MKPLGDGFIKLIKMVIAPIIFGTIVVGIARMGDMRKVGRVGVKALVYFELVTTVALIIGLVIVKFLEPGAGMHVDPSSLDASSVAVYASKAKSQSTLTFIMNIIPDTVVSAFAQGEILQVLLFSILFGVACTKMGEHGKFLITFIDDMTHAFFAIISMIMRLAPIGAFGAMGFTIGKYGLATLKNLAFLMGSVYATCLIRSGTQWLDNRERFLSLSFSLSGCL